MHAIKSETIQLANATHARLLFNKTVRYQLKGSPNVKVGTIGSAFRSGVCIDGKHVTFSDLDHVTLL